MHKTANRPRTSALPPAVNTRLAHGVAAASGTRGGDESGFHLMHDGLSAFVARAVLVEEAEVSLDLQYYIYSDDICGRLLTAKLLQAADRGVRVRLLVDDLGTRLVNPWVSALANHPNMQIRVFNPVEGRSGLRRSLEQALDFGRINHRMHNKLLVADGLVMITGGRNIADGYFSNAEVEFLDVDTMAIGGVLADAAACFDDYWNHAVSVPVTELLLADDEDYSLEKLRGHLQAHLAAEARSEFHRALEGADLAQELAEAQVHFDWGAAQLLADPPQKATDPQSLAAEDFPAHQLKKALEQCRERVQIANAYLIPRQRGVALFEGLRRRAVQVQILTNGLGTTDEAVVHGAYARYRKPLLRSGVQLWELRPIADQRRRLHWFKGESRASLHAKIMVLDRDWAFIGSLNLDSRSVLRNTEIGLLMHCPAINRQLHDLFDEWTAPDCAWQLQLNAERKLRWHGRGEQGESVTVHRDPDSTLWQRLLCRVLGRLPVESQI
ncbi:phospholipase D family protein [Microbulbifer sp. SAOS-129_SWC]|uniref:phospholipase D family protein n=1 Tax=Microbulbifer sp. SAOS-129_SWC TaxID=3145235 RepID=UPI003216AE31